ncbi:MAG: TetR/AcrR family transcriptional regulator [Planctomycetota bacterium]|nr:TetR/AcrR family transcriptional regulator [Planctomycetota bacterium]
MDCPFGLNRFVNEASGELGASSSRLEAGDVARHIAREAARLFASRGYDATSVREIVEAAGVTKPTLYYYFGSKEGLARALLCEPHAALIQRLAARLDAAGDPIVLLADFMRAHFEFCGEDPDRMRFALALVFGPPGSSLAEEVHQYHIAIMEQLSRISTRFVDARLIAESRVEDFTRDCKGLIFITLIEHLYKSQVLGPGVAERLVNEIMYGFARDYA